VNEHIITAFIGRETKDI